MQKRIAAQTAGGIALEYSKRRRRRSRIAGVFSSFGWFSEYSKRGRGSVLFGLARRQVSLWVRGGRAFAGCRRYDSHARGSVYFCDMTAGGRHSPSGASKRATGDSRLRGNDERGCGNDGGEGRNG